MPLLLTESDVRALLPMDHLIATMESALADFSKRRVVQPLRTVLQIGSDKAFYGVMPAYIPSLPALGTKMVTVFHANTDRDMPSHLATITLLDPETGELQALLDGRFITEARTAACPTGIRAAGSTSGRRAWMAAVSTSGRPVRV